MTAAKTLVLVVDDYEDNRLMYAEYLEFCGYRVETAVDGHGAIDKARRLLPAVIAMDMSLPLLDGWEATRILKADVATRSIVIIAVTGHSEAMHIARAKVVGCDHFLTKPFLPQALAKLIEDSLVLLLR